MILPKGKLVGIYRGKPLDFVDRVRKGYLKIYWKDSNDIYQASMVVEDGKITMGEVEFVKSKRSVRGRDILKVISNIDYAVIEVYSVDSKEMESIHTMNDESYKLEREEERKTKEAEKDVEKVTEGEVERAVEEKEEEGKTMETENFEDFILNLNDFTGVVKGIGKDRTAVVYVKDGRIVGAKVSLNGEEFEGVSALYYLDFPAKVTLKEMESLNVDDRIKVEFALDKDEIAKRYDIKPPDEKEIEEVLSVLNELKFEKEKILDRFTKFFRRKS